VFDRASLMICREEIQLDSTQWFIELIIRSTYEGWNFNSGNYLFTTDTK